MKAIAAVTLTNMIGVYIYEIDHGIEDQVLAGFNNAEPQWQPIEYTEDGPTFTLAGLEINLNEAIRI
jgi:hypothetical protein